MDRRTVAGTLLATLLAGGIASLIGATAVPADSPYLHALLWFGMAASAVGFMGLVVLFLFPGRKKKDGATIDQSVTSHGQTGGITGHTVDVRDGKR
jgi:hypothetical protein